MEQECATPHTLNGLTIMRLSGKAIKGSAEQKGQNQSNYKG